MEAVVKPTRARQMRQDIPLGVQRQLHSHHHLRLQNPRLRLQNPKLQKKVEILLLSPWPHVGDTWQEEIGWCELFSLYHPKRQQILLLAKTIAVAPKRSLNNQRGFVLKNRTLVSPFTGAFLKKYHSMILDTCI
jgi:hypothetical protein